MSLTEAEIRRYSRHIILPEVGGRGQRRLKEASVLIIGLQGTGSAAALYLAAAGIGHVAFCDDGAVTEATLSAGIAHDRSRLGLSRAESAARAARAINPDAQIDVIPKQDVPSALARFPIVVATMNDFEQLCRPVMATGGTAVCAATHGAVGAIGVFRQGEPCLQCLGSTRAAAAYLIPESEGEEAIAAAAGVVGTAAATEVVKLLLGRGTPLFGRVLQYDGWQASFQELGFDRVTSCADSHA